MFLKIMIITPMLYKQLIYTSKKYIKHTLIETKLTIFQIRLYSARTISSAEPNSDVPKLYLLVIKILISSQIFSKDFKLTSTNLTGEHTFYSQDRLT